MKAEPSPDGGAGGPAAGPNTDSATTHSRYADKRKTANGTRGPERRGGTISPTVEQHRTVRKCSHVENRILWDRLVFGPGQSP